VVKTVKAKREKGTETGNPRDLFVNAGWDKRINRWVLHESPGLAGHKRKRENGQPCLGRKKKNRGHIKKVGAMQRRPNLKFGRKKYARKTTGGWVGGRNPLVQ